MLDKLKSFLRNNTKYGRSRYLNFLYRYDQNRFFKHSGMEQNDAEAIAAKIRLLVHSLEKGLSVKEQKPDFGKDKVSNLLDLLQLYQACDENPDPQVVVLAKAVLGSYAHNRITFGEDISFIPEVMQEKNTLAGSVEYTRQPSQEFFHIAQNRHSIRTFSSDPISTERLFSAVKLAQTAPSACNRQATHVFACTDPEKIHQVVTKHGGMRGFTNPGAILAITGNLRLYQNEYERNTVFVDGGIFLMNLLYALNANDLAACPIIWGAEPDNDSFLYRLLDIPESNEIISLVVVGNYPNEAVNIPCSLKRETNDIFHLIE